LLLHDSYPDPAKALEIERATNVFHHQRAVNYRWSEIELLRVSHHSISFIKVYHH